MALVLRFLPILLVIAVLLLIFRRSKAAKTPAQAAQEGNGKLFLTLGATLVAFVLFVVGAELITRL
jgi:heme/copper-type cytochrome/quinol oxidase subunit 2